MEEYCHLIPNRGNPLLNDLWGQSCNSFGDWIPKVEDNLFTMNNNDKLLERSLDLIEKRRENATV